MLLVNMLTVTRLTVDAKGIGHPVTVAAVGNEVGRACLSTERGW